MNKLLFFLSLFFLICNTSLYGVKNFVQNAFGILLNTSDAVLANQVNKKSEDELNFVGDKSETPIATAFRVIYRETAEALIKKNVSLDKVSNEIIKDWFLFLLKKSSYPNVSERLKSFIKDTATLDKSFFETTKIVVSKSKKEVGQERTSLESQEYSILHWAVSIGDVDILRSIFEKGKDAALDCLKVFEEELLNNLKDDASKNDCAQLIKDYLCLEEKNKDFLLPVLSDDAREAQIKYKETLSKTKRPMRLVKNKPKNVHDLFKKKSIERIITPQEAKELIDKKIKLYYEAIEIHNENKNDLLKKAQLSAIGKKLEQVDKQKELVGFAGVSFDVITELSSVESINKKITEEKALLIEIDERIKKMESMKIEEKKEEPEKEKKDLLSQSLTDLASKLGGLKAKLKNLADSLALLKSSLNP